MPRFSDGSRGYRVVWDSPVLRAANRPYEDPCGNVIVVSNPSMCSKLAGRVRIVDPRYFLPRASTVVLRPLWQVGVLTRKSLSPRTDRQPVLSEAHLNGCGFQLYYNLFTFLLVNRSVLMEFAFVPITLPSITVNRNC